MSQGEESGTPIALVLRVGQVAALFGRSDGWFRDHQAELERAGFPARDPLIGGWPRRAVEAWLEQRGMTPKGMPESKGAWSVSVREVLHA